MTNEPQPPDAAPIVPGGIGGAVPDDGLAIWRKPRLCRIAWTERLKAAEDGIYQDARTGLAAMAADVTLPDRERRLAREALLADQRAGESVELDMLKMQSEEGRPGAVTVNVHAALDPEAVRAGAEFLARLGAGQSRRPHVEPDGR